MNPAYIVFDEPIAVAHLEQMRGSLALMKAGVENASINAPCLNGVAIQTRDYQHSSKPKAYLNSIVLWDNGKPILTLKHDPKTTHLEYESGQISFSAESLRKWVNSYICNLELPPPSACEGSGANAILPEYKMPIFRALRQLGDQQAMRIENEKQQFETWIIEVFGKRPPRLLMEESNIDGDSIELKDYSPDSYIGLPRMLDARTPDDVESPVIRMGINKVAHPSMINRDYDPIEMMGYIALLDKVRKWKEG